MPYWSIDVLYGISLFVCADRRELDAHARRLLTAQIVAVSCFILLPLRFTFVWPASTGIAGFLFESLGKFDKPFNQAPSLHIAPAGDPVGTVLPHTSRTARGGCCMVGSR